MISPEVPNWSPDSRSKAASTIDSNSQRYSTFKILPGYVPLLRIWLCAMRHCGYLVTRTGHCGKFDSALWPTAADLADLVICYGQLCRRNPYSKKSLTISALWAMAQDIVMRYRL